MGQPELASTGDAQKQQRRPPWLLLADFESSENASALFHVVQIHQEGLIRVVSPLQKVNETLKSKNALKLWSKCLSVA